MFAENSLFRVPCALAACLLAVLVIVMSAPGASPASENPPVPSFATSVSIDGSTYSAIPMGDLGDDLNTFWQLFRLPAGATRWTLDTPTGIADNGGLVIEGGSPSALAVAIRPSDLLTFTPIAVSGARSSWTNGGLIPGAVIGAPNAFVGTSAVEFAAVDTSDGAVLRSKDGGSNWTRIASGASLTYVAAGSCQVRGVRAARRMRGRPCMPGRAARKETAPASSSSPALHGATSDRISEHSVTARRGRVLTLSSSPRSLVAMIATTSDSTTRLVFARSSSNGASWATTSLRLPPSVFIVSAGTISGTGAYVVWRKNGLFAAISSPNGHWSSLPELPGTAWTLAFPQGLSGAIEALGGRLSTFNAWRLDLSTSHWSQFQTIAVPIIYGSSS